jgi:peroxiredoxin
MNVRLLAAPAAALLLAACAAPAADGPSQSVGAATPTTTREATPDATEPEASAAGETVKPDPENAFAFTAMTVDGQEFDGLSIDNTDVVLWFWAPWCPTCQLQARTINEALAEMPSDVQMIGIAGLSDDLEYMKDFVRITGVDGMTHVADLDGDIFRRFEITQQSTVLFIDDSGQAWLTGSGATADQIVEQAEKLAAN